MVAAGWYVRDGSGMDNTDTLGPGKIVTAWDGEVAAIKGGLRATKQRKVLILSDSQAAVMAIKKAGRTGRARTKELRRTMDLIAERQEELGPGVVWITWVKAHVGIEGNEKADEMAKLGTIQRPRHLVITEGGLNQWWKEIGRQERQVTDTGGVIKWERKARANYTVQNRQRKLGYMEKQTQPPGRPSLQEMW